MAFTSSSTELDQSGLWLRRARRAIATGTFFAMKLGDAASGIGSIEAWQNLRGGSAT
jgi:hypothetical protein